MLKIAYCDDMETDRERIRHALYQIQEKVGEVFEVFSFSAGHDLCEAMATHDFDIILLDILMDGLDGIETANQLLAMGGNSLLIFISSYEDRLKELFQFRTIAFIEKPLETYRLEAALKKAADIIKTEKAGVLYYKKGHAMAHIPMADILYLESQRNTTTLYTASYQESFYGTLANVWQQLVGTDQFIMPHKSFIFNLNHVYLRADRVVIKTTGEIINIGKKYKEDTEKRYTRHLEKRYITW